MHSRSKIFAGGAALAATALSLALVAPANADGAPTSTDIVGVGSDTVQNIANFLADGDPALSNGINSTVGKNRLISFDATPDANDRAGYLQNSTFSVAKNLSPTIILRAATKPIRRPNGSTQGVSALIADGAANNINFARMSRLPKTIEQNGVTGGLRVIRISTDDLRLGVVDSTTAPTHAPAALTAAQLAMVYLCDPAFRTWDQITPGASTNPILPLIPPSGGTRDTFLADLSAANGSPVAPGTCVVNAEENDPAALTGSTVPQDTIAPFSVGRLNLYASNYFLNPNTAYPAAAPIVSGVKALNGAGSYLNTRGLYIVFRDSDTTLTTPWQPGGAQNWVTALFRNPNGTPYVNSTDGQAAIKAGGATPAYRDCGAGAGVISC